MTPLDIIAAALHEAWRNGQATHERQAEVAAHALLDERVVANAVQALKTEGWGRTRDGSGIPDEDLANIARTVFRSVGGQ